MLQRIAYIFLRMFLRTRRGQRWRDKITAPGNLIGAPADEEKLWQRFKLALRPGVKSFIRIQWVQAKTTACTYLCTQRIRVGTVGVHLRIRATAPVKPSKKFLITLTKLPLSVKAAERCVESAKRYGEDHNLEIMPAIDKFESQDFFIQHNLTWEKQSTPHNSLAAMGCFSSHFKLWLRCMELGEPIIVLEHDAVFRAPIPPLKFKHIIVLGEPIYPREHEKIKAIKTRKGREIFHLWHYLLGTHCYAIKPEGARKLVEAARRHLLIPADHFMCKQRINILYYHPCPVYLDPQFSSIATDHRLNIPIHEKVWKNYEHTSL